MRCVPFNPASSLLSGMPTDTLRKNLADAQQAYVDLSTGAKGESYSYTQGDGAKSVTYTRGNLAQLAALIQTLQAQLGIVTRPRNPIRPLYRR
ncbi:gpW family head-tail joining protein [Luteibacter yeojuensis]|nr:gpW family head-tail joining protein [Luteibacter yeojuensis]